MFKVTLLQDAPASREQLKEEIRQTIKEAQSAAKAAAEDAAQERGQGPLRRARSPRALDPRPFRNRYRKVLKTSLSLFSSWSER